MTAAPETHPGTRPDLNELRQRLAMIERRGALGQHAGFSLGVEAIDSAASLSLGALHEIYAREVGDAPAASAMMLAFAMRAAGKKPIVWVRQDFARLEMGEIYAPGLAELGLDPDRLVVVRVRDGPAGLRAAEEAVRCSALGAVLLELWGEMKALDLVATRRLALAAEASGVPLMMMRAGARPAPSAAASRWLVRSAPSIPLEAEAPGHPAFALDLVRSRSGPAGGGWIVEWNRDQHCFRLQLQQESRQIPVGVAPALARGPHPEDAPPPDRRSAVQ